VMLSRSAASAEGDVTAEEGAAVQQAKNAAHNFRDASRQGLDAGDTVSHVHYAQQALSTEQRSLKETLDTTVGRILDGQDGFGSELSSETGRVDKEAVAEEQALIQMEQEKARWLIGSEDGALKMKTGLERAEASITNLLNSTGDRYQELRNQTRSGVESIQHGAAKLLTPLLNKVTAVQSRLDKHFQGPRVGAVLGQLKTEYAGEIASSTHALSREAEKLKMDRGDFQALTQHAVGTVANVSWDALHGLLGAVEESKALALQQRVRHEDFEKRQLEMAGQTKHAQAESVESLEAEAKSLDVQHTSLQQWGIRLAAQAAAYQAEVVSKLRELSGKEPATTPRVLRGFATAANASGEALVNGTFAQDIAATMALADSQIAAILKDERLSEAEQEKQIQAIRAETASRTAAIFGEQEKALRAQEMVSVAAERFDDLSHAALNATQRAVAAGHLSPEAVKVQARLEEAVSKLQKIHTAPWLVSDLQLSAGTRPEDLLDNAVSLRNQTDLRPTNRALQQANAELRSRIFTLEHLVPG